MLRLPPSDLLTATHLFETLAGTSKLPHFDVLKQFRIAVSAASKVSVCQLVCQLQAIHPYLEFGVGL
jgi:hypothetical protein